MTRINVGIHPYQLTSVHLLAEHREIKRVPNNIVKRLSANKVINIGPPKFCLGPGHVNFFNDKLGYLHRRYLVIYGECLRRGFLVQDFSSAFIEAKDMAPHLYGNWRPDKVDRLLIVKRLIERDKSYAKKLKL